MPSSRATAIGAALAAMLMMAWRGSGAQTPDAPYRRYTTPDECVHAGLRVDWIFWRNRHADTVRFADRDTLAAEAVDSVRRCASAVRVDAVHGVRWLDLVKLRVMLRDDSGAAAAVDRFLAERAAPADRAPALLAVVETYLGTRPVRLNAARVMAQRIEALGPAAPYRLMAYTAIAQRAMTEHQLSVLDEAATAALHAYEALTADQRKEWRVAAVQAFMIAASAAVRRGDIARAKTVIDRGLSEFPEAGTEFRDKERSYVLLGTRAPSIDAKYWFNTPGNTMRRPTPNTVSLVTFAYPACGANCYGGYGVLRRLARNAGPTGLDVTLITPTVGWFARAVVAADSEAALDRDYFLDRLDLPVALAVIESAMQHQKDGRRFASQASVLMQYQAVTARNVWGVLVDRAGIIRAAGVIDPSSEAMWTAVIKQQL
jgi:hypothetical protein